MNRFKSIIIAIISIATISAISHPALAQTDVKVKKWRKYDVGEIRFNDKAKHKEGSKIYNKLIPNPED